MLCQCYTNAKAPMQSYQCEAMPCQLKATIVMRHPDIYKHGYQRVAEDSKTLRLKVFTKRLPNFWWKAFFRSKTFWSSKRENLLITRSRRNDSRCVVQNNAGLPVTLPLQTTVSYIAITLLCIAVHCGTFPYIAAYCQSPNGSLLTDNKPNRLN